MRKVEYAIFKKVTGTRFPGEFWEGPLPKRKALKKFKESYYNETGKQDFRLVKITYDGAPEQHGSKSR